MPDGTGSNQGQGNIGRGLETLRESQRAATGGLEAFRAAAEKVERDPNIEAADNIRKLDGNAERMTQLDEISSFTTAIVSVIAKLERAGGNLELVKKNPESLAGQVMEKGLVAKLSLPEHTALKNLHSIISQGGDTSNYLRTAWPEIVDQGLESSKGWTEKLKNQIKKDPVGTIGLMAIGVGVAWASWELISKLWKDEDAEKEGGEDGKKADTEEKKNSWLKAKILIPIGIVIAAGILGRGALKKLLAGLGIEDLQKLLASGESIPEDIRKQIEEQRNRILQLEEAAKKKLTGAGAAIAGTAEGVKEKGKGIAREVKEIVDFDAPRDLLIKLYCFDNYSYGDVRRDVKKVFDDLRGKNMSDIMSLWNKYKDNKENVIPNNNELLQFHFSIKSKNIYTAFRIIATTFEAYKNRFSGGSYPTMTLEKFLSEHIAGDPIHKLNEVVQGSLLAALKEGDPRKLSLEGIKSTIENKKEEFLGNLAQKLGIDLKGVNKLNFATIVLKISNEITLQYNENDAIKNINTNNYDSKTIEAVKKLFKRVKERTLGTIIPKCIERFNLTEKSGSTKENADIIKLHLNEKIGFDKAIQLSIVSLNIDFDKGIKDGSGQMSELALLYAVLDSIPEKYKQKYLSELASIIISTPANFQIPSIAFLLPYFNRMKDFGIEIIKSKYEQTGNWISAFVNERSPEQQKKWLEKIRTASALDFSLETVKEGVSGTLRIGKDCLDTLTNIVGVDEIRKADSLWDIIFLIISAGGHFFYSKNKDEQHTGIIYLGGKYFFYKPGGILSDSMSAWAKGIKENNSGLNSTIKTYAAATSPFVVIGSASAYYYNKKIAATGWDLLARTALGGAKGFLAPGTLPVKGFEYLYRSSRWLKESGQTAFNITRDIVEYGSRPGHNINIMLRDAKFVQRYFKLRPVGKMSLLQEAKWVKKMGLRLGVQRFWLPAWNERLLIKYSKKMLSRYNTLFGYYTSDVNLEIFHLSPNPSYEEFKRVYTIAEKTEQFFKALVSHPDFPGAKTEKLMGELLEKVGQIQYKGEGGGPVREPEELAYLKKRVTKPGGLKNFLSMLDDAGYQLGTKKGVAELTDEIAEPTTAETEAKVTKTPEGKYKYMGEEFAIAEDDIVKKMADLKFEKVKAVGISKAGEVEVTAEEAVEALCKERYAKLGKATKAAPAETANAGKPEKFMSKEALFEGTEAQLKQNLADMRLKVKGLEGVEKSAMIRDIQALNSFLNPKTQSKLISRFDKLETAEAKSACLAEYASEIEARSSGVSAYIKNEIEELTKYAKSKNLAPGAPEIQKKLNELENFTEEYSKNRATALNELTKKYKELPWSQKTPEMKARVKLAIQGPDEAFLTKLKITGRKALLGRAKIGAAFAAGIFGLEYFTNKDPEKELFKMLEEFSPTATQILVDILPFVGTGSMFYGAISGKESVTGKELDTTGRVVTGIFGVASLAADALTVLAAIAGVGVGGVVAGGLSTSAKLAVLAGKGGKIGKEASIILSKWPRIYSLMTRMGPKAFGESAFAFMKGGKTLKTVKMIEKTAVISGIGVMGSSMIYSFVGGHEIDIPEDIASELNVSPAEKKQDVPEKEPAKEPVVAAK